MASGKDKKPRNSKNSKDPKDPKQPTAHEGVISVGISNEMREAYLDYAMSVITARALPDVRDGLKPVHRRILYTMHSMNLSAGGRPRKSAAIVGEVLGKYHPHGDSAVYEAMVKMAQPFSLRYPLVIGQGNFGSIDGDPAAAMRYTEAKMGKMSVEILRDIEKETVPWRANYDNTRREPVYLPAAVPNLLLNGTLGIAVGMASNIPPHNLSEVVDATVYLADNPKATTEDLAEFVKGPDFPTGGIVYGQTDIRHAYASGRGGVVTRGEAVIEEEKSGSYRIVITSLPYRTVKADLLVKIADLVRDKRIEGIKDLRDESTSDIRVVVDLKQGVEPNVILNALYKHTDIENTFNYNMVALVDGVPQTVSLKTLLEKFLEHRTDIVTLRTKYDLRKAQERAHILEGLKKALDHIDAIIKTIKSSKDVSVAKANLIKQFKLSEVQATAILEMKLQKLAGLERKQVENELKEKKELIADYKDILAKPKRVREIIKDELAAVKKAYGDQRRTRVVKHNVKAFSVEDLIEEKESVMVLTRGGYVKRTDPSEYKKQRRGGVGVVDLNTKEEDVVTTLLTASTHADLLFFTDRGKAYQIKMYEIPEGRRATKGKSIMNYLSLSSDERVTSVLEMPKNLKEAKNLSLCFVTAHGNVKKVKSDSFTDVRRSGIIAMKLQKGDELLSAFFVEKGDTIFLATRNGQAIRFKESDIRQMGRTAGGVRGIRLSKGDIVVGAWVIKKDSKEAEILVVSEKGYGKRTSADEFKIQKRGGTGIKTANVTEKIGKLIAARIITSEESEIVAISRKGQIIRTELKTIPELGRATQGVRIMKLRSGDGAAAVVAL